MLTNIAGISLLVLVSSIGAMLLLFAGSAVQKANGALDESGRTMDLAKVFMAIARLSFFVLVVCAAIHEVSA